MSIHPSTTNVDAMSWPRCDCVGCVLREISQRVWVGLFSSWGEWPEREDVLRPGRGAE